MPADGSDMINPLKRVAGRDLLPQQAVVDVGVLVGQTACKRHRIIRVDRQQNGFVAWLYLRGCHGGIEPKGRNFVA